MNTSAPQPGDKSPGAESGDWSPHSTSAARHSTSTAAQSAPPETSALSPHDTAPCPETLARLKRPRPHAPVHKITEHGVYFVTAGTLDKAHRFHDAPRLDLLELKLLTLGEKYRWQIEAWAAFSNHYHLVCRGCPDSADLVKYLKHLHSDTARELNRLDRQDGRQVWHNFREPKLTFEKSYLARLHYVHQNAVKHGLVLLANQYRWCSAAWFERVATPAQVQTIYAFKTDQVNVEDDY